MDRDKRKIGRNEICHCGSGKKYKKCCGQGSSSKAILTSSDPSDDPEIKRIFAEMNGKELQRVKQQGRGRPIISNVFKGYRFVAVANRLYYSKKWKTFHDFLTEYIQIAFGKDWFVIESRKQLKRHPIIEWYEVISRYRKEVFEKNSGNFVSASMTGAVFAYHLLSYNLYLLAHNAKVQQLLIDHLKSSDHFYGGFYETVVAANFIKAGFQLDIEDEYDNKSTHCEFTAFSPKTKKKYSIEAKTRTPGKNGYCKVVSVISC